MRKASLLCLLLASAIVLAVGRDFFTRTQAPAIVVVLAIAASFLIVRGLWASRQGLAHELRWMFFSAGAAGLVFLISAKSELRYAFALGAFVLVISNMPRRSRSIPGKVKRVILARDLKGDKRRLKDYEYDHTYPFSDGGGHTADNIRLIPKKANRKKGAKRPKLTDWF